MRNLIISYCVYEATITKFNGLIAKKKYFVQADVYVIEWRSILFWLIAL